MRAPDLVAAPLAAVTFLTRLPFGPRHEPSEDTLLRAAPFFPLVGAVLGLAVGGVAIGFAQVLPPLIAGLLAVAVELLLTGALHVDGLADSADGLGGRDREHSLAIMRDHSLGAYGASALTLDLAVKAVALGALAEAQAPGPVVAAFAISRVAPLPLALLPYARDGEGVGRVLAGHVGRKPILMGAGLAIAVALAAAGLTSLVLLLGAAAATLAIAITARRRLGGVTGDVMGAAIELSASGCLVIAVALL